MGIHTHVYIVLLLEQGWVEEEVGERLHLHHPRRTIDT